MTGKANNIFSGPRSVIGNQNPWELSRLDVTDIRFYGYAERMNDESGRAIWKGGQEVLAIAYERQITRLWGNKPNRGFDLNSFNGTVILS